MIRPICLAVILTATLACGGDRTHDALPAATPSAAERQPATGASFRAIVSGAAEQKLEGTGSVAGAKYNRYHINMASQSVKDGPPTVVIAFGRTDTTAPTPGTYSLGGREGFRGSVEIYSRPQRDFLISDGELIISEARGDVLTGRFTLTAREQTEEYTATPPEIRVEGTFQTRPAS
ncbi:hypothetical protein BH23ACI1_BH23ACI1_17700 [soil metagenome]|nr:hypothetical protein [Acidobacteriota bacterium]